ncbi:MAG: hypothetical protein ACTTH5_00060 [Wolinella sp.]
MTTKEKITAIDEAIEEVLSNLKDGIFIKEYTIDNLRVSKRSPLELIEELRRIRQLTVDSSKNRYKATHKSYIFGDKY